MCHRSSQLLMKFPITCVVFSWLLRWNSYIDGIRKPQDRYETPPSASSAGASLSLCLDLLQSYISLYIYIYIYICVCVCLKGISVQIGIYMRRLYLRGYLRSQRLCKFESSSASLLQFFSFCLHEATRGMISKYG